MRRVMLTNAVDVNCLPQWLRLFRRDSILKHLLLHGLFTFVQLQPGCFIVWANLANLREAREVVQR